MPYDPDIHNRRSIRLPGYDYSQSGVYFITICTKNRKCLFGEIVDGKMRLNETGTMAKQCWDAIPDHFPQVLSDQFVVMPNHIHGIIFITQPISSGHHHSSQRQCGTSKTIGSIVRGFKIGVTKWIRQHTTIHDVWQRNYWDHIIRNETDLHRIREYIQTNPTRWESDTLHPRRGE